MTTGLTAGWGPQVLVQRLFDSTQLLKQMQAHFQNRPRIQFQLKVSPQVQVGHVRMRVQLMHDHQQSLLQGVMDRKMAMVANMPNHQLVVIFKKSLQQPFGALLMPNTIAL